METINPRDLCITTVTPAGNHTVRRRVPQQTAWELYAHRNKMKPDASPTLGLAYQAWWQQKREGVTAADFDQYVDELDEIFISTADGTRVEYNGRQFYIGDDELDVEDEPRPTHGGPGSAN